MKNEKVIDTIHNLSNRMDNGESSISNLSDRMDNGEKAISNINNILNFKAVRTLEDFGLVNLIDNSDLLLKAMNECANNKYILCLNKKYRIAKSIVYNGVHPLTILGTCGQCNDLTKNVNTFENESCNLYLNDNVTIEINKLGSTYWNNVGISGSGKDGSNGIIIKSFHNKFIMCNFSQLEKALFMTNQGANNWAGENQILYNNFSKCKYCMYIEGGSDSEVIGNIINSSCDYGYYGQSAGFTISLNHFYNSNTNVFTYFNTKICNNYIQVYENVPPIELDGSFGCMISNNNFELSSDNDLTDKKWIIQLYTHDGRGNIYIDGNAVHGKSYKKIKNLSFIGFKKDCVKYDNLIKLGNNNLKCCDSIFSESYPLYNIETPSFSGIPSSTTCSIDNTSKYIISNGIVTFYAKITSPTSGFILQFPYVGAPFIADCVIRWTTSPTPEKVKVEIGTNGQLNLNGYETIKSMNIYATYMSNARDICPYHI